MALEERQRALARQILLTCREELWDRLPYLDGAFSCLQTGFLRQGGFRVDGRSVLVNPGDLLARYSHSPEEVRRGYLHMVLHCLFLHIFPSGDADPKLWNLSCDLAVESLIASEKLPRFSRGDEEKRRILDELGDGPLSAQEIYALLCRGKLPESPERLEALFRFDDHAGWYTGENQAQRGQWERLLVNAAGKKAGQGRRGSAAGAGEEEISLSEPSGYDYRAFLRRFTFPREEVALDPESFDYIFYHFGMEYYGSMPLIEPLEYREVRRLEELVIAMDTSGSCSAETVSRFLSETYAILAGQENFFRKMKVYFIQCDCLIQDVTRITSREEWLSYAQRIRIQGRGGTDFRPVFDYVHSLRTHRELENLKALLYFTDGDGAYPSAPPDYETAFVLLKESGRRELVPGWGTLLLI